jgi:Ca-activated chloride channel homolog
MVTSLKMVISLNFLGNASVLYALILFFLLSVYVLYKSALRKAVQDYLAGRFRGGSGNNKDSQPSFNDYQNNRYQISILEYLRPPIRILLQLILGIILTLSLFRPYYGYKDIQQTHRIEHIQFVVDISKSMLAVEEGISRLDLVKKKLLRLLASLEKERTQSESVEYRIGIVLFASKSYVFCPLTSDTAVVEQYINSINFGLITSTGSNLADALQTAFQSLHALESKSGTVAVFTDGEDKEDETLKEAVTTIKKEPFLNKKTHRLLFFGVGRREGSPIPLRDGSFARDSSQNVIITKLQEDTLRQLAEKTNGKYIKTSLFENGVNYFHPQENKNSYAEQNKQEKAQSSLRLYYELTSYFAVAGIFLVLFEIWYLFSQRWRNRHQIISVPILLVACLTMMQNTFADDATKADSNLVDKYTLQDATSLYSRGEYKKAEDIFRYYQKQDADNPEIAESLAGSLYKQGEFEKAINIYTKELELRRHTAGENGDVHSKRELYRSYYNRGTAYLKNKQYQQAIEDYEKIIAIDANDKKTLHNLHIAKKQLAMKKQSNEDKTEKNKKSKEEDQNSSTQSSKQDQKQTDKGNEDQQPVNKNEQASEKSKEENRDTSEAKENQSQEQVNTESANSTQQQEAESPPSEKTEEPSSQSNDGALSQEAEQEEKKSDGVEKEDNDKKDQQTPEQSSKSSESEDSKKNASEDIRRDQHQLKKEAFSKERSMSETEALRWLNNLPETSLLLRQKRAGTRSDREALDEW